MRDIFHALKIYYFLKCVLPRYVRYTYATHAPDTKIGNTKFPRFFTLKTNCSLRSFFWCLVFGTLFPKNLPWKIRQSSLFQRGFASPRPNRMPRSHIPACPALGRQKRIARLHRNSHALMTNLSLTLHACMPPLAGS